MERTRNTVERRLSSEDLLRAISCYLADNIGNKTAASRISQSVGSTDKTVALYLQALDDAYIFYPVKRYDLHGRETLKTLPKQYIVDLGIRSFLMGYRPADMGRALENAVFLQLLDDGWSVHVGSLYEKEVDFIGVKDGTILYVQVTADVSNLKTMERALVPLRSLRDNYKKVIVVRNGSYPSDIEGINIIPARDFLRGRY